MSSYRTIFLPLCIAYTAASLPSSVEVVGGPAMLVLLRVSEVLICNNLYNKRGEMNIMSYVQMPRESI
jgi:hypothetical protein